jgi:nitrogen fixation/metabolism regulation signal transduction histidine kinase
LSKTTSRRPAFLQRRTLEYRLFFWLLGLAIVPALVVLGAATWIGRGTVDWLGTLGPWNAVSESGSSLIAAAQPAARRDPALASALERHRNELEASLVQAHRWSFLGARIIALLPLALLLFALILTAAAFLISRRLARELSRPIQQLAAWTERIAQEQPLPPATAQEGREVREVQALRQSLRHAAEELGRARVRALQVERTRAWGEMARRIAHEMKNPLTPLRLAAYRLREALPKDDPAIAEPLRIVSDETHRLEQLAREFGMLGRPAAGPRSPVDIGELISSLLQSDVPGQVDTRLHVQDTSLPLVDADYNALQQSFRNVLRNAVDAVAGRPNPSIDVHLELRDGAIVVTVRDNGPGFEADALTRVFEPDYTTKPRGTGLGLTIARQAIEAHEGRMTAARASSGGAEVIIELPASGLQQVAV